MFDHVSASIIYSEGSELGLAKLIETVTLLVRLDISCYAMRQ